MPSGIIFLWSGAISAIPPGFVICDGNNSTPNLTDRFVIHADADSSGTRNKGDTGGAHTVTLGTNEMPAHTHNSNTPNEKALNQTAGSGLNSSSGLNSLGKHAITSSAGGGAAHQNMPKFFALAYVMKT